MDAAEFSILALQIVQVIGILFLKPWAQGYSQEKSKNYARQEDMEVLLTELRAFTSAQKLIETKFADDLWSRQTLRNEKRAVYGDLLVRVHEAVTGRNLRARSDEFFSD